jgi:hypothetical protein
MNSGRDPQRYREEAAAFRKLAEASADSRELRDSYLALALQYERLATILEKASSPVVSTVSSIEASAAIVETAT